MLQKSPDSRLNWLWNLCFEVIVIYNISIFCERLFQKYKGPIFLSYNLTTRYYVINSVTAWLKYLLGDPKGNRK